MKHKSNVLRSTSCLKIFQEKGEIAIQKELQQIHDVEGFEPKHWHELTKEQRAHAL
jgi:hypothetical protein